MFVPLPVQLLPSFFFKVGGFYLGRWWWWRTNVTRHRTNTAQTWVMEHGPNRRPGLQKPSHPDPVRGFTTVAPTAAHSPHDLKNPPPVPWCPIPEDTQTGPVSHVRVLWADNVRAVWMAFKSHTCTHTNTIESFPSRVCPALTSKSVQSEKRTTAALKDHHALSFTHPQTRTAHTYS